MRFPDDVRQQLTRLYRNKHREWLSSTFDVRRWPLMVTLGIPTEQAAMRQAEDVRAWVEAWQRWQGPGVVEWRERRWRSLGTQRLPETLVLGGPADVAAWVGEADRWRRAKERVTALCDRWPALAAILSRHFDALADYGEIDFRRLVDTLAWLADHPESNLYPRQLPIAGLDSKWLEGRKALICDLLAAIQGDLEGTLDFYKRTGLKAPPQLIRMRVLDPDLRRRIGGLGDITAPLEQIATLDMPAEWVFVVENLQTGLAFPDVPGGVVFMRLGYGVEVLARIPWIAAAQRVYWGDLDTHGLAILNRAKAHLHGVCSLLMDEATLLKHKELWGDEDKPVAAESLPLLTETEQAVFQGIKQHRWGQNVRMEQERIDWDYAMRALDAVIADQDSQRE